MTFVFAVSYASGAPGATGRMSRRRSRVERRADLTSVRPTPPMRLLIEDFERPPTMRVGRRRCVRDSTPAQLSATWGPLTGSPASADSELIVARMRGRTRIGATRPTPRACRRTWPLVAGRRAVLLTRLSDT